LYGVRLKVANKTFFKKALHMVCDDDSVASFLAESKPSNPVYYKLLEALKSTTSWQKRQKLLCNMERCRWNQGFYPQQFNKYVWVNIPSLSLQAIDNEQILDMRICLGSLETKTPLINSYIKRIDFNPQWIIPKSIIKKSVCQHAGDNAYFDNHNYFIRERKTGKIISPSAVTCDMLCSSDYLVIQHGGKGNALGRVIFRFDNDFSIYLHDTSNPEVFSHRSRTVSHGCVRVEKPFELAVFMLADKDNELIDKMRYSITTEYDANSAGNDGDADKIDRQKMLRSLDVTPEIPIFIAYYTLYPDSYGHLTEFPDIYGYDSVVLDGIRNFIR
jgi:L,D-transpeptidase YcbB